MITRNPTLYTGRQPGYPQRQEEVARLGRSYQEPPRTARGTRESRPSLHPLDLLVGLCCGAGLRLAVYLKSKNAKKYRHGMEYGSARWGTREDIAPYIDPVFQNNEIGRASCRERV